MVPSNYIKHASLLLILCMKLLREPQMDITVVVGQ